MISRYLPTAPDVERARRERKLAYEREYYRRSANRRKSKQDAARARYRRLAGIPLSAPVKSHAHRRVA